MVGGWWCVAGGGWLLVGGGWLVVGGGVVSCEKNVMKKRFVTKTNF